MTNSLSESSIFELAVNREREKALTESLIAYNKSQSPLWNQNHDDQFAASPLQLYVLGIP